MIIHQKIHSSTRPQDIEITETSVFVASNITEYTRQIDGHTQSGYEYDWAEYDKDEFLVQQSTQIAALQEELQAAKILLGVD